MWWFWQARLFFSYEFFYFDFTLKLKVSRSAAPGNLNPG